MNLIILKKNKIREDLLTTKVYMKEIKMYKKLNNKLKNKCSKSNVDFTMFLETPVQPRFL